MVLCLTFSFSDAVSVVSTTDARLPVGLSKVLLEVSVDDADGAVAVATLLFSRSVTRRKRANYLQNLVGSTDSTSDNSSNNKAYKAVGTDSGLIIAQPGTTDEVTASVTSSGGNIVWIADAVDLARGEGLLDDLGPAMEVLLNVNAADAADSRSKAGTLIVVTGDIATGRAQLDRAVQSILSTLVSPRPVNSLEDIFEHVEYVTSPSEAAAVLKRQSQVSALAAKERISAAASSSSSAAATTLSLATPLAPTDIAAARQLGPVALKVRRDAVQQVQAVCHDNNDGSPKLVVNFGALCDAAIQRALDELEQQNQVTTSALLSSAAGSQIRSSLRLDLETDLFELFQEQMEQVQLASFEDFKKGLSKLLISPNLAADMEKVGNKAIAAFATSAKKMLPKKCAYWSIQPAKDQFRRSVKEYIQKRLLAARAGGQYKPLPRKGVTVGLHWLLPKPFGNDFRQEPWMVHATDNMVYVPKDKITDVSPDEVKARDWRNKIVPSPVGNEMIYMQ